MEAIMEAEMTEAQAAADQPSSEPMWLYLDAQGQEQGPYTTTNMLGWRSHFPPGTQV